jgi:glycosyltransferase involved in cell wall biosynthesis
MACGLAPVVTEVPGPAEHIEHGVNGLVVPPRDSGALEAAVEHLLSDEEFLTRLRHRAYETAQQFGWNRVAAQYLDLYRRANPTLD